MFFFNPELLLISGVDSLNPADPAGWVWITNPLEILIIFTTAFAGMIAFSSATQGYFMIKTNIIEKILFFGVMPFMFLPKIMESYLHLPSHYVSYIIGLTIFAAVYFMQKSRKKNLAR